jgi:hypothetical protein
MGCAAGCGPTNDVLQDTWLLGSGSAAALRGTAPSTPGPLSVAGGSKGL